MNSASGVKTPMGGGKAVGKIYVYYFWSFGILLLHLYIISFYVFVFVCIHFSTIIFVFGGNVDGRWDCP